ncbi:hypothetical protein Q4561_11200 [Alteromonas sp. 1_MG-2023]|uniref:hypothetical protein n=1 Tax=Alteromonas sp. 1_MG-2023 TaxID=3062669 RepID=UPI0026E393AA|nr:hypothetical protein [Alteromonas sp. 1_MG-2023]MDO6567624.1 hypothetical protein [Alteromonas sp. 1_MG-2023]
MQTLRSPLLASFCAMPILMVMLCSSVVLAHSGHIHDDAVLACKAKTKGDTCSYIVADTKRYKGSCQIFNENRLCVRNKPIEYLQPVAPSPNIHDPHIDDAQINASKIVELKVVERKVVDLDTTASNSAKQKPAGPNTDKQGIDKQNTDKQVIDKRKIDNKSTAN